ncbi:MAG: type II toxin-antitoxin system VapC family toxin [Candidatus Acidiferrales bacterium]
MDWYAGSNGVKATAIMPKGSELILVDSSGWIEFLGDGPRADRFAPYFEQEERLLIPAIVLYEVYKKLLSAQGSTVADRFLSAAMRARFVPIDERLALAAAQISLDRHLAMADAMIYASALAAAARLVTADTHFQGLPGATVIG